MAEWVENPDVHSQALEEDAALASIARRLNPDERKVFLDAVEKVRKQAGKGAVRLKEPNTKEKLILDTYERMNYSARATADALGVDLGQVYNVTQRFGVRPVELKLPALRNPSEHLLRFIRQMYGEGKGLKEIAQAVKEIAMLENVPSYYTMLALADKAGIDLRRPKFDVRLYPELIADFDAIGDKYGFSVGTLHQHYMKAKKAQKGLPT